MGDGRAKAPRAPYAKLKPGPGRSAAEVARHQRVRIHSAMVEIVAEHGYEAVTLRGLAQAAGVSTRAFYQHYSSKHDCFWSVHQLIVRRLLRSAGSAQAGLHDPRDRIRHAVQAIVREWDRNPRAARLMLIDAQTAGPDALMRVRKANRSIGASLFERGSVSEALIPPLFVEGVIAGITAVVRSRLLGQKEVPLRDSRDELTRWALSYQDSTALEIAALNFIPRRRGMQLSSPVSSSRGEEDGASTPRSNLALLLSSTSKLAATEKQGSVTLEKILATAGVSRRSFNDHFEDLDDVLIAAEELHAQAALVHARHASGNGLTAEGSVYRIVSALCTQCVSDPAFTQLCIGGVADAGPAMRQYRELLVTEVIALFQEVLPSSRPSTLAVSVHGLFGILQNEVSAGRVMQLPYLAEGLTGFVLIPTVGISAASKAINQEVACG